MQIDEHKYANELRGLKVLLVGVFPPPLGGISVHLRRAQAKLEQQGCEVWRWDVKPSCLQYYWQLVRFCLNQRPQVIIYHTMQLRSWPLELFILLVMGKVVGSKNIAVIHSARFVARMGWLNGQITSWLLRFYDQIVLVSGQLRGLLAPKIALLDGKISTESPFLPPVLSDQEIILGNVPADLANFLAQYRPIITVSVTRLDNWQGQDLYGVDLAQAAFELVLKDFPKAGLLIVLGNQNGRTLKLGANAYLLSQWPYEMWPLIGKSDLFIRPTRSDSNALTVMEAIYLGVPVVASDVCARPSGAVLFKSGDAQALYEKMKEVLTIDFQKLG